MHALLSHVMQQQTNKPFFISTTFEVPGHQITGYCGLVFGATVRARGMGGDCMAGCQATCGGEVSAYTEMAIEARNQAVQRMVNEAMSRGANAVIGLKFDSDNMGGGNSAAANGIIVYGTAVSVNPM